MDLLVVTLSDYKRALGGAIRGCFRHLSVVGALLFYFFIMAIADHFLTEFGTAGSLIMCTVRGGCISSYLYLLREVISPRSKSITRQEFVQSFGAYLSPVMNVTFTLFIAQMVLKYGIGDSPMADQTFVVFGLATGIAFNVVAEAIYVNNSPHARAMELFATSIEFLRENWLVWFVATLFWFCVIGLVLVVPVEEFNLLAFVSVVKELPPEPFAAVQGLVPLLFKNFLINALINVDFDASTGLLANVVALLGFHVTMLFRGHLYVLLSEGTQRQRAWRRRMGR